MVELRNAKAHDYIRFVLSALLLLFSLIVTSYAIWQKNTLFWDIVPGYAALILFVIDLFCLGVVEGLQIALVELKRQHPDSYKKSHPRAYRLGQIAARGDNVERFLMGRQVCVVFLVFFAAKLTTIHLKDGEPFLFPVPSWVESTFFETGFMACIVVVIIAQLMPQIVAAKFPVHFLQLILMYPAYYFCVFLEATGITHICWVLSHLMSLAMGMKDDETTKNPVEFLDGIDAGDTAKTLVKVSGSVESGLSNITRNTTLTSLNPDDTKSTISVGEVEKPKLQDSKSEKNLQTLDKVEEHFSQYSILVEELNKAIDADTLKVLRHYLDNHPEKFYSFPSVVGGKMYPAPQHLAQEMQSKGLPVPKFLTNISDPEHIPPHIVACELLGKNRQLQQEITELKRKLYGPYDNNVNGNLYVKL